MDVNDPRLRQQSRFSRASEHATHEALERAGSTDSEINRHQLIGHLQATIFKNLLKVSAVVWLVLSFLDWIDFTWTMAGVSLVVVVLLYLISFPIAKNHSTRWEWVDVGGGYVRKDALEAASRNQR
jgi:hypothetical protein